MDLFVKISLMVAVLVCYPVVVGLGIEAFIPVPDVNYEECYRTQPVKEGVALSDEEQTQMIQKEKTCREAKDAVRHPFEARIFVVASIFGLLAIILGALALTNITGPGGPGLVFGGVITILYGTMRTFNTVDKKWLFIVALLTLGGVLAVSRRWLVVSKKTV